MAKRRLWITCEKPLIITCECCKMRFSGGDSQLAKSDVQAQFNAHECEPEAQRSSEG